MRYVIIDPFEGVFLGTRSDPFSNNNLKIMVLFSKHNVFEITKAASWKTRREANAYRNTYIKPMCPESFIVEIPVDTDFVDVIDLVRAGYGQFAHEMIDSIPMNNTTVH